MIGFTTVPWVAWGKYGLIWWIDIFHAISFVSALKVAAVGGTEVWSPIMAMPMVPVLNRVAWAPTTPRSTPPNRPS